MSAKILEGNVLETLKDLPACSVQCVVTSPPYYGLRDYGTAEWKGGDPNCDHVDDDKVAERNRQKKSMIAVGEKIDGSTRTRVHDEAIGKDWQYRDACKKCGAIRIDSQIGLEPTPEAYVEKLVQVFREVRRVLKDDGTLWLNLGDSYAGSGKGANPDGTPHPSTLLGKQGTNKGTVTGINKPQKAHDIGLKPKDLIGIPWMVAFALRADGWYLRSDIIWAKPNPMPESVRDRPTKSHEYIFLLTKSQDYFYDYEAVLEPANYDGRKDTVMKGSKKYKDGSYLANGNANSLSVKGRERWRFKNLQEDGQQPNSIHERRAEGLKDEVYAVRNKRDVWTVNTKSYSGAHFATFPTELIEPCILAGTKEGDTVLDPFNGSGTTGEVSIKHHRLYIGCELNPKYVKLTHRRLSQVQPVLMQGRSLTPREPDKRDSAPSQAFSQPEFLSDLEGLS